MHILTSVRNRLGLTCLLFIVATVFSGSTSLFADSINLGSADDYALLFQGGGGNTLQITNVTVNGNIGVGNTGRSTDSGPSTINGRIDFAAANTGQWSNNNASNVIAGG